MQNIATSSQPAASWQEQLRQCIQQPEQLLSILGLTAAEAGLSEAACRQFPLKVTHSFVNRMRRGDPTDPLLLQVLATAQEDLQQPGFSTDPVGEIGQANPRPGVLHKYHGRALLIVTAGCAIHCRYCFRRHFPYQENRNTRSQWQGTLDYVARDDSIEEVILSGGDPLIVTDAQLASLVDDIAAIPHVKRLRVHTRLPVVLPDRVTDSLVQAITRPHLDTVVVVHSNHANEINDEVRAAMSALAHHGITLLNQAVLLAGINDTVQAQSELNRALFEAGILPYYLHLMDKVHGASHFDSAEANALQLHRAVQARLPGYMVPRLVKEEPGAPGKTLLS